MKDYSFEVFDCQDQNQLVELEQKLYKYFGCEVLDTTRYNDSIIDLFRFKVS